MISRHCHCARHPEARLKGVPGIRILNEVVLNQLAIAFGQDEPLETRDRMTKKVIGKIREENLNFVLGANWKGQQILRISIISRQTDTRDIDSLADSILAAWKAVQAEGLV